MEKDKIISIDLSSMLCFNITDAIIDNKKVIDSITILELDEEYVPNKNEYHYEININFLTEVIDAFSEFYFIFCESVVNDVVDYVSYNLQFCNITLIINDKELFRKYLTLLLKSISNIFHNNFNILPVDSYADDIQPYIIIKEFNTIELVGNRLCCYFTVDIT